MPVSKDLAYCAKVLISGSVDSRLGDELSHINDDPILVMGRTLPHILPHVLLNKREVGVYCIVYNNNCIHYQYSKSIDYTEILTYLSRS